MGVGYDCFGCIGIRVTEAMVDKFIAAGLFTEDEWHEDPDGCCETVKLPYSTYGSACSGEETRVLLVEGNTFGDIKRNAPAFIERLKSLGFDAFTEDKLEVIPEGHIW